MVAIVEVETATAVETEEEEIRRKFKYKFNLNFKYNLSHFELEFVLEFELFFTYHLMTQSNYDKMPANAGIFAIFAPAKIIDYSSPK